jgi:hypothetical protein
MDVVLALIVGASAGGVCAYRLFTLGLTLAVRRTEAQLAALQAAVEAAHHMRQLEAGAHIEMVRRLPPVDPQGRR